MEFIPHKSGDLMRIVDRLSVEKTLHNKFGDFDKRKQEDIAHSFKDVIIPELFDKYKCTVENVTPGGPSKVRRREYITRRSRTTEGAALICQICEHLVYKLYASTNEKNGKQDNMQLCRSCFVEQNGGQSYATSTGEVRKTRPSFEHSTFGLTNLRASSSWHFIRRDFIQHKAKALLNHRCNENQYVHDFESDDSGCTTDSSVDEDTTCYEDSDHDVADVTKKVLLPFQVNTPIKVADSNSSNTFSISTRLKENKNVVELSDIKNSGTISIIVDKTSNKSNVTLQDESKNVLNGEDNTTNAIENILSDMMKDIDKTEDKSCLTRASNSKEKLSALLLQSENIDIQLSTSATNPKGLFTPCFNNNNDDEQNENNFYFDDRFSKISIVKDKEKPLKGQISSIYKGVCGVVTILNSKGSHLKHHPDECSYFDRRGFAQKKQDLPSYIGINTNKYTLGKGRLEKRKSNVDKFINSYQPRRYVRAKRAGLKYTNTKTAAPSMLTIANESSLSTKKIKKSLFCAVCKVIIVRSYSSYYKESAPKHLLQYFLKDVGSIRVCRKCYNPYLPKNVETKVEKPKTPSDVTPSDEDSSADTDEDISIAHIAEREAIKKNHTSGTHLQIKRNKKRKTSAKPHKKVLIKANTVLAPKVNAASPLKSMDTGSLVLPIARQLKGNPTIKFSMNDQSTGSPTNEKTKYLIVQTPTGNETKTLELEHVATFINTNNLSTLGKGDITFNGQKYRIDSEFKLNDLVKDNENAVNTNDTHRKFLEQLPSILKRTMVPKGIVAGGAGKYKIVNVLQNPQKGNIQLNNGTSNTSKTINCLKSIEGSNTVIKSLSKPYNMVSRVANNTAYTVATSTPGPTSLIATNVVGVSKSRPKQSSLSIKMKEQLQNDVKVSHSPFTNTSIITKSSPLNSLPIPAGDICITSSHLKAKFKPKEAIVLPSSSPLTKGTPGNGKHPRLINGKSDASTSENRSLTSSTLKRPGENITNLTNSFKIIDNKFIRI